MFIKNNNKEVQLIILSYIKLDNICLIVTYTIKYIQTIKNTHYRKKTFVPANVNLFPKYII